MKTKYLTLTAAIAFATSAHAVILATNTNTGFGGVLGNSVLEFTDDGTNLTISWQTGGGTFNDSLVIYFDTMVGGAADTTSFTDIADGGRRAISGTDGTNVSNITFGGGFTANSALSVDSTFAGFFDNLDNDHNFVTSANLTGAGSGIDPYVMTLSLSDLGVTPGNSFDVVATYLNSGNAFRSDEALASAGLAPGNPGQTNVSFAGFDTVTTVPEPSAAALLGLGGLALILRRRRK